MSVGGTILVTGATGQQGGAVARELLAAGHSVRAMTRNPDGEAAGALADAYVPITVTEAEGRSSDLQFQVSGVVQNTSAEQADSDVLVIVTAYDAQGLVTGFRQGMVEFDGTLAPGATAPFTVRLTIHGGVPTDEVPFSVIALGRVPSE